MQNYNLEKDIQVMCLTATSFPDGVMDAYKKLQSLITDSKERRYFGISHPNKEGVIIYKACAEVKEAGETEKLGLESFIIKAGDFMSIYIDDHMKDPQSIGNAFQKLLKNPNLDPQGYCLEMYKDFDDKDVQCMVPLK
ncbi:MAG: effector binding domain-containing protein [Parcubacteria group bacterium]